MKKNLLVLSLLILTAPACVRKKRSYITDQSAQEPVQANLENSANDNVLNDSDEDIGAFVLDEDKNPFTSEALNASQDEELTLTSAEPVSGDIQADSANYGLKRIYFDFDQYEIRPDQQATVDNNLKIVKNLLNKGYKIVIEGHACDSAGSDSYNLMLSEDRAKSIANYFEKNGVDTSKISLVGRGSMMKVVPFGNREQQAPNRRVEIYAYSQADSAPIN